jgi:hypothetical protein
MGSTARGDVEKRTESGAAVLDSDAEAVTKQHPFAIDDLTVLGETRPEYAKQKFVARCMNPRCGWQAGPFETRAKAIRAVHWHHIESIVREI